MANQVNQTNILEPSLLLGSAVAGLLIANGSAHEAFQELLNSEISFGLGPWSLLQKSLLHLINDGLMSIFFLYVGLELKREILVGELSNAKKVALPILTAIGGVVTPAIIYVAFNQSGESSQGWGIPMATDIAFALGLIAVLGDRVPASLRILLAAIAIVDDLAAVLVIAFFYTSQVDYQMLACAVGCLVGGALINRAGVVNLFVYLLLGLPLWYFMLKSGVHAAIAGVLLASVIPFSRRSKRRNSGRVYDTSDSNIHKSPALMLEKRLSGAVTFLIMPLFALANSGVSLKTVEMGSVSAGIALGLVIGKPLGILGAFALGKVMGWVELPRGVSRGQFFGLSILAGIGFTMSLFISALAFQDQTLIDEARVAVLMASLCASALGTMTLVWFRVR